MSSKLMNSPDGSWPGQTGVKVVVHKLEKIWARPIPIVLPPADAKDVRTWFVERRAQLPEGLEGEDMATLGREFIGAIEPPNVLLLAMSPRSRRSSRVVVKAFRWNSPVDGGSIHTDKMDIDDTGARARFALAVAAIEATTDVEALQARLMNLEILASRSCP